MTQGLGIELCPRCGKVAGEHGHGLASLATATKVRLGSRGGRWLSRPCRRGPRQVEFTILREDAALQLLQLCAGLKP